jgi:hypothetical protein
MVRHGNVSRRFDLSPAEEYGKIHFLLSWNDTKDLDASALLWMIRDRLNEQVFTRGDYILMTGDWTAMALTVHLALEATEGYVQCLQWDKRERKYHIVEIDMNAPPPDPGNPYYLRKPPVPTGRE